MRRVQFDAYPRTYTNRSSAYGPTDSGRYKPSWASGHAGEQISSRYDMKYPTVHTNQHSAEPEQVGGWQFNLSNSYLDNYPLLYDESDPFFQTQLRQNEVPRTAVFELDQPIVLTSHDDIPIQKYSSYVVEEINETKPENRVRFESQPVFENVETLKHQATIVDLPFNATSHQKSILKQKELEPDPVNYLSSSIKDANAQRSKEDKLKSVRTSRDRTVGNTLDYSLPSSDRSELATSLEDAFTTGPRWRRVHENRAVIPFGNIEAYEKEFFIFYTKFKDPTFPFNLPRGIRWYNRPKKWENNESGGLKVFPRPGSDFWQKTYFGSDESKDSGHFLYLPCTHSQILLEVKLSLNPKEQNDQAGVMIRYDRKNWVRAGLEFIDGGFQLTCVCTINGFSDWSIQEYKGGRTIEFKLFSINGDVIIEHRSPMRTENNSWKVLRLAHLETKDFVPKASQPEYEEHDKQKIHNMIGLYSCRPSNLNSDVTSYAIFHYMSVRHCDQYERNEDNSKSLMKDETYGSFRKIAGPYIADEDFYIEPDKPHVETFEIY